jgi:adenosylcobinamide-GDP ribazoletransferase
MKYLRIFINLLAFLTILPLDRDERFQPEDFGRFSALYPAVGLVLGLFLFLVRYALAAPGVPDQTAVILTVTVLVIVTRGFHLDGLADTMDALLSHRSREDKLRIMKDPHQGTFGVLAILLDVLLKISLLATLLPTPSIAWALVLFPVWGRYAATVASARCSYARAEGGLGKYMVDGAGFREFFIASVFTAALSAFAGWAFLLTAIFTLVWGLFLSFVWNRTLGGMTGDLLGATVELTEIASLFFLVMTVS